MIPCSVVVVWGELDSYCYCCVGSKLMLWDETLPVLLKANVVIMGLSTLEVGLKVYVKMLWS